MPSPLVSSCSEIPTEGADLPSELLGASSGCGATEGFSGPCAAHRIRPGAARASSAYSCPLSFSTGSRRTALSRGGGRSAAVCPGMALSASVPCWSCGGSWWVPRAEEVLQAGKTASDCMAEALRGSAPDRPGARLQTLSLGLPLENSRPSSAPEWGLHLLHLWNTCNLWLFYINSVFWFLILFLSYHVCQEFCSFVRCLSHLENRLKQIFFDITCSVNKKIFTTY